MDIHEIIFRRKPKFLIPNQRGFTDSAIDFYNNCECYVLPSHCFSKVHAMEHMLKINTFHAHNDSVA